jgi:hypothetical protein
MMLPSLRTLGSIATGALLASAAAAAPAPLAGHWTGTAGPHDEFALHAFFFTDSGRMQGTFDMPSTGGRGIPLTVRLWGDSAHFEFARTIVFKGLRTGDAISGSATFLGRPGRFRLARSQAPRLPYREESVRFKNGAVTLAGTLTIPSGPGAHPAVVIFSGAGSASRFANVFFADHLARMGIASLIYDKRGAGQSTGDWATADFDDLAGDGLAGVQLLKSRAEVDPRHIGLMGGSQAGWIIPITAAHSPDVSFMIMLVAPTSTMAADGVSRLRRGLHAVGAPDSEIALAVAMLEKDNDVTRTGKGLPELEARAAAAVREPWFRLMGFKVRPLDHPGRVLARRVIDVDPMVSTRQLRIPSLWLYGAADREDPTSEDVARLEALKKDGRDLTVRVIEGADQALWVPDSKERAGWPRLSPEYLGSVDGWLRGHGLAPPASGGRPPSPTASAPPSK